MTPAQPLPSKDARRAAPRHLVFYGWLLSHKDNRV
jgi:hypothetical protein